MEFRTDSGKRIREVFWPAGQPPEDGIRALPTLIYITRRVRGWDIDDEAFYPHRHAMVTNEDRWVYVLLDEPDHNEDGEYGP